MVVEPQGVLMCRSSTLKILANSGPFRRLLLTILARFGVSERFSRLTILGCYCMSGINTHSFAEFCPFRGLLLTILGPRSDLHDW